MSTVIESFFSIHIENKKKKQFIKLSVSTLRINLILSDECEFLRNNFVGGKFTPAYIKELQRGVHFIADSFYQESSMNTIFLLL